MTRETTQRILRSVDDLGKLPPTITRIVDVAGNPSTSPRDLAAVIKFDPVLTFEILKLVNSAFYSLRNEVTSLTQAVVLLGMNTVKNLCLSIALAEKLTVDSGQAAITTQDFWKHSMLVAIAARLVAAECMRPPSRQEDYFLAGLLHDMGKLVLANLIPAEYEQLLVRAARDQKPLESLETDNLGITHSEVGAKVGEKWNFSEGFIDAVLGHHMRVVSEDDRYRRLQIVVAVANSLVHTLEVRRTEGEKTGDVENAPDIPADALNADGHRTVAAELYAEIGCTRAECFAVLESQLDAEFQRATTFLDTLAGGKKKK